VFIGSLPVLELLLGDNYGLLRIPRRKQCRD
jgi:hypothetical protein